MKRTILADAIPTLLSLASGAHDASAPHGLPPPRAWQQRHQAPQWPASESAWRWGVPAVEPPAASDRRSPPGAREVPGVS